MRGELCAGATESQYIVLVNASKHADTHVERGQRPNVEGAVDEEK